MVFKNRMEAGRLLAARFGDLSSEINQSKILVFGIPNGGIVIGSEIASLLKCDLDALLVKKIGAPGAPELAIGAVGMDGKRVVDERLVRETGADDQYLEKEVIRLREEIDREKPIYCQRVLGQQELGETTVIIADDGIATGATMLAAISILRQYNPQRIVVAAPVVAKDALSKLESASDGVVYLEAPEMFFSLSQFYDKFDQVGEKEACRILKKR